MDSDARWSRTGPGPGCTETKMREAPSVQSPGANVRTYVTRSQSPVKPGALQYMARLTIHEQELRELVLEPENSATR